MEPIQRLINANTHGNLWMYIISLGKDKEIQEEEVARLIFEKFGFLPNDLLVKSVLFRLKREGYISKEKFMGKKAYKATEKGLRELGKMKDFHQTLLQRI